MFGQGPAGPAAVAEKDEMVCAEGVASNHVNRDKVAEFKYQKPEWQHRKAGLIKVDSNGRVKKGGSGGPVWDKATHASIDLMSAVDSKDHTIWYVQPLLTTNYGNGK